MRRKKPVCVDRERDFRINELFFSMTDLHGVIKSGNDVFVRVSGYKEAELIGKPHSAIRHPDMPASVFRIFWNYLQSEKSIAAYVKNRAKDGEYYWVMAVATPVDGGYLSVRLKPTSELLSTISDLYARVLAEEEAAADKGLEKDAVVEAGQECLYRELAELGFDDYDSFMEFALVSEVAARHEVIHGNELHGRDGHSQRRLSGTTPQQQIVAELIHHNQACDTSLAEMLAELSSLERSNKNFLETCSQMGEQSEIISVVAINASVSATTAALDAISAALAGAEKDSRRLIESLTACVNHVRGSLTKLAYNMCVAAMQSEIASHFLVEIHRTECYAAQGDLQILLQQADHELHSLFDQLESANTWFNEIAQVTEQLQGNARTLRFIRMAGVAEATHLPPGHAFAGLFDEVKSNITSIMGVCTTLRNDIKRCRSRISTLNGVKVNLGESLEMVRDQAARLDSLAVDSVSDDADHGADRGANAETRGSSATDDEGSAPITVPTAVPTPTPAPAS